MNSMTGFLRLTWKEYRSQRALWLSVLVLTALLQLFVVFVHAMTSTTPIASIGYLVTVFIAVAVYMLGCGATLFALEHEAETFDFQRSLPIAAWQVYVAKIWAGFLSGIGLMAALLLFEHTFFVGWRAILLPVDWLTGIINCAEVFLWAVLFSLLLRSALLAAVCGIAAMSIMVCLLLPMMNATQWQDEVLMYHRSFLGTRVVLIAALLALDTWLTWRWFHGKIGLPAWLTEWKIRKTDDVAVPTGPLPVYVSASPIGWRRLIGITWRQGRWVLLLLNGLFLWAFIQTIASNTLENSAAYPFLLLAFTSSMVLFGLCAFTMDQWSYQFRFYAERGVSPRWLWFSRHFVWFSTVLIQVACFQWLMMKFAAPASDPLKAFLVNGGWLVIASAIYAVSQLCAMLIHRTLVAVVVCYFAALMCWMWMMLMVGLGIPTWWSLLPLPIVAFFATWLFSPDWISERRDWRRRIRVAGVLGIPSLMILTGYAFYRAYEIPLVSPGFDIDQYTGPMTAAQEETLRVYAEADAITVREGQAFMGANQSRQVPVEELEQKWLEAFRPVLPLLEKAHEQAEAPITLVKSASLQQGDKAPEYLGNFYPSAFLLAIRLHADSLTRDNKLSEAWRQYEIGLELINRVRLRAAGNSLLSADVEERVLLESIVRWSAHPEQTKDRIAVAITKLQQFDRQESTEQRAAKVRHVLWREFVGHGNLDPSLIGLLPQEAAAMKRLGRFMPWEKTRFRRLLNWNTSQFLTHQTDDQQDISRWLHTTFVSTTRLNPPMSAFVNDILFHRRATMILIALSDWQRTHQMLPGSLNELTNVYFHRLPLVPISGRSFGYFPNGLEKDIAVFAYGSHGGPSSIIPKNTPFLWTPRLHPHLPNLGVTQDGDGVEKLGEGFVWPIPRIEGEE